MDDRFTTRQSRTAILRRTLSDAGADAAKTHWKFMYTTKSAEDVSWYQAHAERSLDLIRATGAGPDAPVIDVGGGTATRVDDLLTLGFRDLSVLDLPNSATAPSRRGLARSCRDPFPDRSTGAGCVR
ncbi:hypothetical protein A9R05_08365 [Burkholderia sp. KK1]|nr:hypothetical protein A9R05_08365 [Burkholderia sp. KK1]